MIKYLAAFILVVISCSCALLLVGSTGTDKVGVLKKKEGLYTGTVTLRERNRNIGIGRLDQKIDEITTVELTNLTEYPIIILSGTRLRIDRDSLKVKELQVAPGQTVVAYHGIAFGMACGVRGKGTLRVNLQVGGLEEFNESELKVYSSWGVGP